MSIESQQKAKSVVAELISIAVRDGNEINDLEKFRAVFRGLTETTMQEVIIVLLYHLIRGPSKYRHIA